MFGQTLYISILENTELPQVSFGIQYSLQISFTMSSTDALRSRTDPESLVFFDPTFLISVLFTFFSLWLLLFSFYDLNRFWFTPSPSLLDVTSRFPLCSWILLCFWRGQVNWDGNSWDWVGSGNRRRGTVEDGGGTLEEEKLHENHNTIRWVTKDRNQCKSYESISKSFSVLKVV